MKRLTSMTLPWLAIALLAMSWNPALSLSAESKPMLRAYTLSTLNRVNYHRRLAGADPVSLQSQINAAAQAHADYLTLHQNAAHEEINGLSGFTGQCSSNRMTYQGYNWSAAGEVISYGNDAQAGVDSLIAAIYHRFILLNPAYSEIGIGDADHAIYTLCQVIDLGQPAGISPPAATMTIYPADGQTEVPTTFNSDDEIPDPAPDHGLVGYPVSIQFSDEHNVTLGSFTISKKGTSDPDLDTILLQPGSNSSMPLSNRNFALIPTSPLQADSTYEIFFSATVNGTPFDTSWNFTTAPPAVLRVTPNPATLTLGQTSELEITGGSGNYSTGWTSSKDILSLDWASSGNAMLITPKALGTATITLTDTSTQAVVKIPVTIISGAVPLSGSQKLVPGWNLLTLPLTSADTSVTQIINGIKTQVTSVWKWSGNTWAVYLGPNVAADGGALYASSKSFGLLTTLSPGEGFWLNATSAATLNYSGSSPTNPTLTLAPSWNLVGLKTTKQIPIGEVAYSFGRTITSLWSWHNAQWAVTLPTEYDGGAGYAKSKGFDLLQTIEPGQGFWVNADN